MSSLTQVWVFTIILCTSILVAGFKFGGRLGLLISFFICFAYIYLFLNRGIERFFPTQLIKKRKLSEWKGSDPSGFIVIINDNKDLYEIDKVSVYYTSAKVQPLVWKDFSDHGSILINSDLVQNLDANEKLILAHWLLAHLQIQSPFLRRFLALLYLSFFPFNYLLSMVFSFVSVVSSLRQEVYKADLLALKNSNAQVIEYCLFLRKLHNFKLHKSNSKNGEIFFTPLSNSSFKKFNLQLSPSFDKRTQHILGYST